jgi:hypothetical protein
LTKLEILISSIEKSTIGSEVERGLRNITLLNLERILAAFEVSKEDTLRLLITEDLSKDEADIIEHRARLLTRVVRSRRSR